MNNWNRVTLVLVILVVAMQGAVLYRQFGFGKSKSAQPMWQNLTSGSMLDIEGLPTLGNDSAQVVLAEFSDYECPFCVRHSQSVEPEIRKQYVDSGKIKYVFMNNPLPIHHNAEMLAISAYCAGVQGRYWEMHDSLFASRPVTEEASLRLGKGIVSDYDKFQKCSQDGADAKLRINDDRDKARNLSLTGTPGFAIGRLVPGQHVVKIKKILTGAAELSAFVGAIKELSAAK